MSPDNTGDGKAAGQRSTTCLPPSARIVANAPWVDQTGFAVIRRRWVVERSFAWIVKNRRFVRDYEQLTAVAETIIMIAATVTLIRRWQ